MGQPFLHAKCSTIHFLAGEAQDLESLEEILLQPGQELLFVALPNHTGTLEGIKQRWPGGQSYIHLNGENNPMYATYRVLTP